MKWIAQFLGSIIYTAIFTMIMYFVFAYPITWLINRPFWLYLLFFLFYGFIQVIQANIQAYAMIPYFWLLKSNVVALATSVLMFLAGIVINLVWLWKNCTGHGFGLILFGIIVTWLMIGLVLSSIAGMFKCYTEDY